MVNQHSRRLVGNRRVVEGLMDQLETTMASASRESVVPVSLPVDKDVFIWTYAAKRLARNTRPAEGIEDDSRIDYSHDVVPEVDDETAQRAVVELDVADLGLDDDDDDKIEAAIKTPTEQSDKDEAQGLWEAAIRSDVDSICRHDSDRLYRMFMAIMLEISRAHMNEEAREIGRDRVWKRGGSMGTEEPAVGLLREVRGFGMKMAIDGYFALGVSGRS